MLSVPSTRADLAESEVVTAGAPSLGERTSAVGVEPTAALPPGSPVTRPATIRLPGTDGVPALAAAAHAALHRTQEGNR